ncbi:14513_t:CDS:2, partial [Gigaspora margarita]
QTKSVEELILFNTSKKLYMIRDNKLDKDFDSFSKWIKALKTSRKLYKENRSALATIFLENNCSSKNIEQILKGEEYQSYWKSLLSLNLTIIMKTLQEMTIPGFDDIIRLRGNKIMSNELNENQCHNVIATLEDQECYRQEDCLLIEKDRKTCIICTKLHKTLIQIKRRAIKGVQSIKTTHASDKLLIQHVKETCKIIYKQKCFIELLKAKIKIEEEPISEELERVINEVAQE